MSGKGEWKGSDEREEKRNKNNGSNSSLWICAKRMSCEMK